MNGATEDRHNLDEHTVNGQGSPPVPAPAARQSAQNRAIQNQTPQSRSTWTFSPRTRADGPDGRKASRPDASTNLVLSALASLPLHGIDRLTGMPVLLHRLNEFVVPVALPDSPHLLPVTEVDIWDAHPYAVTELPPAAVLATHPATAALGVLRALTALHAAGQVHGGLNAGQFWQVGREVRLAGAGLPWQPGAGADADMHALGQALDTLGARPTVLLGLEQMTARQALSALEGAMQQPERAETGHVPAPQAAPVQLQQPALTRADLGRNGATDAQATPSMPGRSAGVPAAGIPVAGILAAEVTPAAEVSWNRRKTDQVPSATMNQVGAGQATASQAATDSRPEEAVVVEVAARTVIAPVPAAPVRVAPDSEPTSAPLPYRSADDVIVIGEVPQASPTVQASPAVNSEIACLDTLDSPAVHPDASAGEAGNRDAVGEKTAADASREPGTALGAALSPVLTPIRIGFTDLPDTDGPDTDLPDTDGPADLSGDLFSDLPGPLDRTPMPPASDAPDLQTGRATRFAPARASENTQTAPATGPSTGSVSPALNPAQRARARHSQTGQEAAGPAASAGLSAGPQAEGGPGAANRMQPLRIGWEEDHSWRVVKSGPERRGAMPRRFPVWLLALVLLALLAGAAFWLLGRAGSPGAVCCTVPFTVSGSAQPVSVTLVTAPPGSTLQPGAVIGTAPGELKFPNTPGPYTLKFSAQGHGALTAAVSVPSSQPFAIVLK